MSIQLVLTGEVATAHWHIMAALRFVVEGSSRRKTVDGLVMEYKNRRRRAGSADDHLRRADARWWRENDHAAPNLGGNFPRRKVVCLAGLAGNID